MIFFWCVARALHKRGATKQFLMKTNPTRKSTYSLILQSEEKERSLFETVVYSMLVLSAVIGIWQFAHLRIPSPFANTQPTAAEIASGS
jgi:hypothetical protein